MNRYELSRYSFASSIIRILNISFMAAMSKRVVLLMGYSVREKINLCIQLF